MAHATIWYVNLNATGAQNGSSWADAFVSPQQGLSAAQAGDEIWVAKGVYYAYATSNIDPVYLKTQYAKDPVFANTKTVYSVYEKSFTEKMHKNFLKLALIGDEVKEKDLASFKELTHEALVLGGVQFADAIIQGSENIKEMDVLKKAIGKKPFLPYQEQENILPKYVEFYQSLI